jgi:cation diffusion facilitator CzcD-associated flavoprotein CzcO
MVENLRVDEQFDILIIGAGVSGIGIACRLARRFPDQRIGILERRKAIGGTWDLFRYPGIRSDSDMFTYAYDLRPWQKPEILADGASIREYLGETVDEFGVRDKIRFGVQVEKADWDSSKSSWTVTTKDADTGERQEMETRFLVAATGYYDQDKGYMPDYPGADEFEGSIVHPQHWPDDLDFSDKKVVVIGSGATAATVVPAMAGIASHVTMLQRSPSYYFPVTLLDPVFTITRPFVSARIAARMARGRNQRMQYLLFKACRRWPNFMRRFLLRHVEKELGSDVDMRHFTPRYAPWDERVCVLPNDDLLHAVRSDYASVVTDTIEQFTPGGIRLSSGEELEADIIVSATGFNLRVFGAIDVSVDGEPRPPSDLMIYKGILVENTPNLAVVFGYINFAWTAKVDIAGQYLCRLFEHMDKTGQAVATPRPLGASASSDSIMNRLNAGYVKRGADDLPRQGDSAPWQVTHDYRQDRRTLLRDPIDDGVLEFHG